MNFFKIIKVKNMSVFENHKVSKYRELHERMLRFKGVNKRINEVKINQLQ